MADMLQLQRAGAGVAVAAFASEAAALCRTELTGCAASVSRTDRWCCSVICLLGVYISS